MQSVAKNPRETLTAGLPALGMAGRFVVKPK